MFDPKQSYWYSLMSSKPGCPPFDSEYLTHKELYKFRCKNKVVYHIVVEEYKKRYFFIKYYPARMQEDRKKYKVRTNCQYDFSKIIGTCAKLTSELIKKRPEAFFGFVGQWDDIDVRNDAEVSQRFELYKKICPNLFPKEKYTYVEISHFNMMMLTLHQNMTADFYQKIEEDLAVFLATPEATALIMPTLLV